MSAKEFLNYVYWTRFSKPVADREVYRWVKENQPRSIVEMGLGQAVRTQRMIQLLLHEMPAAEIRYAGIDLFESRSGATPGLPLKQVHSLLKPTGIKVQLIPGDPYSALARAANGLTKTDLLLISADQDAESLSRAWAYVPRMLTATSRVLLESNVKGQMAFVPLTLADVEQRAAQAKMVRRAA